MGAAGREFLMMRMEEKSGELYVPTLSKKEVNKRAIEDVKSLVDEGYVNVVNAFTDASRLNEYLTTFVKEIKNHITEEEFGKEYEAKGCKITFRNSGDRLNYEQDEVYKELKDKLKEREILLKTAYKSKEMIFDSEGIEVPKVGVKTVGGQSVVLTY